MSARRLTKKMTAALIRGLRDISVHLRSIVEITYKDLSLNDLKRAEEEVERLIDYYEKNSHLNSQEVSLTEKWLFRRRLFL